MPQYRVFAFLGTLVCLILGSNVYAADPPAKKAPVTVAELNERPVIGQLGIPLGTCGEIQAKIIAGRELRLKQYDGAYLLSVTHVGGKELKSPDFTSSVMIMIGFGKTLFWGVIRNRWW